jgi:hypothetical protein
MAFISKAMLKKRERKTTEQTMQQFQNMPLDYFKNIKGISTDCCSTKSKLIKITFND